ncbi:tetratricopeptide repeat protein [Phreatobacter stygius]|uniref:Tetratricopeptide repeat protein n=1 Tax=Phreatobacter stygius TaxID=1940610 RepID=A0A4D7BJ23_9HYPH|nr:hypothetical protein [Phreatobacter stygius]QCI67737.1 hypothetical protein E8M01_28055 [Phreatobacter stygius]
MSTLPALLAASSMIACASPGLAQNSRGQAVELCVGETLAPRDRVRGCDRLIRSGRPGEPDLGAYYFYRAHGYWALRQFERAETDVDQAIARRGGWAQFMLRGDIRIARGNLAGAIDDFTAATEFVREQSGRDEQSKTNLVYALLSRAEAMHGAGRLSSASFDLDEVIELKPDFRPALDLRARVRAALGDHVGAEQDRRAASAN